MAISTAYNVNHAHHGRTISAGSVRVVTSLDGSLPSPVPVGQSATTVVRMDGCDACPNCADVCGEESCVSCREKVWRLKKTNGCGCEQTYTMCEIRRHKTTESAWLVAGDYVYDATTYIVMHPGGEKSILKKCGGVCDCTQDLMFHSKQGQKVWKKYRIGKVKKCCPEDDRMWWMFWK